MSNPFTPGYGQQPPYLAGRSDLIESAVEAIRRGPGAPGYHRFIIGARGTGKTVTLDAMATTTAVDHGAIVIRWTAGSRPLTDAIAAGEYDTRNTLRGRWRRTAATGRASATIGIPGLATATAHQQPMQASGDHSDFGRLQELARHAAKRKRTIIVWVDEAQNATPPEIAALAAIMQEAANIQHLPIAVWAAGLPAAQHRWIDAASSLERQPFTVFDHLDPTATAAALQIPIRDNGKTVSLEVLDELVAASRGFPYVVQLIGAATWDHTVGNTVTHDAAQAGINDAVTKLQEQLFVARWRQMTPATRDYLAAAADAETANGTISSTDVADRLGATVHQVSVRRDQLINTHHVLTSPTRGQLAFTQPGLANWVRTLNHHYTPLDASTGPTDAAHRVTELPPAGPDPDL